MCSFAKIFIKLKKNDSPKAIVSSKTAVPLKIFHIYLKRILDGIVQLEPKLNPRTNMDNDISHDGPIFDNLSHGDSTKLLLSFFLAE